MPSTLKKPISRQKASPSRNGQFSQTSPQVAKKFFVSYFRAMNGEAPETKARLVVQAYREAARTKPSSVAQALLRGIQVQNRLKELEGGSLSADEVRPVLGLSKQGVLDRHRAGALLGWREKQNAVRFPAWQFNAKGVLPGLVESLEVLNQNPHLDDWAKVLFYLSPRESLAGGRPLDLLRAGKHDKVKSLAEDYGR